MEIGFSNRRNNFSRIKQTSFSYIKGYFVRRKGKVFFLSFSIILGIIANSITPFLFGNVIDNITVMDVAQLKDNITLFFLFGIITQLVSIVESLMGNCISVSISNEIKEKLMRKILLMKAEDQDRYSTGELVNRLEGDADTIVGYYMDLISSCLMIVANIVISIAFLLKTSKILTGVAVLLLPFNYIINFIFKNRIRILKIIEKKAEDENYKFINCVLNSLKNTKVLQIEKRFIEKYKKIKRNQYQIAKDNIMVSLVVNGLQQVINQLFEIVIVFVSAMLIIHGKFTIGSMVSFNSYLERLFNAISKLLSLNLNKQVLKVSMDRLIELENKELENISFTMDTISIEKLEFKNVCFGYSDKNVINQLSFTIDKPGIYSFVGENGVGKTTILKIISKLYGIQEGEVLLNNKNISCLPTEVVRNSMSYMMKETLILPDSLWNNLTLGVNRNVSVKEVEELCNKLKMDNLMNRVGGYSGNISSDKLSSGEKQRIGLIRVILKKAKIILLDEVTSDLDGNMESIMISLLQEIADNAIVINVCHRKNLIISSKYIFVINNGQIVEQGVHDELKKIKGYYFKLFENTYALRG